GWAGDRDRRRRVCRKAASGKRRSLQGDVAVISVEQRLCSVFHNERLFGRCRRVGQRVNRGIVSVKAAQGSVGVGGSAVVAEVTLKFSLGAVEADIDFERPQIGISRRSQQEAVSQAVNEHAGLGAVGAGGRGAIAPTERSIIVL